MRFNRSRLRLPMTRGELTGRTAVVTGSTGEGMGRQIAWTLAREGANVVLNYGTYRTNIAGAKKAVAECKALGGDAVAVRADTRKEADIRRLVEAGERAFGPIDIAVANGGGDWLERRWDRVSQAEWHKVMDAEVDGALLLARAVVGGMRRRGWGRIVFISWDGAARSHGTPLDYTLGKQARDALAEKLARLEETNGITVNTVAPGYIPYLSDRVCRDLVRHGKTWTDRNRSGPQDVAECVAWLCGEASAHVSGSYVRVHGPRKPP